MSRTTDRLGLALDPALQLATLRAGWRFYKRASERADAQDALEEWVDAVEAVLDLGVAPAALGGLSSCLEEALAAPHSAELGRRLRTLSAALAPPPFPGAAARVRALREQHGEPGEPSLPDGEAIAVDVGVKARSAQHVSDQLRSTAA